MDSKTRPYQQPTLRVTKRRDVPWKRIADLDGNPTDEGRVKRLIHPQINGSPDVEFFFGIYQMEPGEHHPLHYHPSGAEFYYILSGVGRFRLGDDEFEAGPGTAMYLSRDSPHGMDVVGDEPLEIVYGFSPPDLDAVGIVWLEEHK